MKKFINRPEDVVEEMLQGMVILHPGLARLSGAKVIIRADSDRVRDVQVALISGGGSGHEPAHAGYVGEGMLSAAVAGEIFTSPSSDSVFAAIKAVSGTRGALLIVKNYTGDRLNFGLAAEMARAEGIPVEMVLVDDDVALKSNARPGARGLAGTVLIHKLLGAAAAEDKSLPELAAIGNAAVKSLATMGVSFAAGTSPAVGRPSFELGDNEIELGLGIHGEPGVKRTEWQPASQLSELLIREILKYTSKPKVAVMVNNLGATTAMELAIVASNVSQLLDANGLSVERLYAGMFLSSLDMAGISISVLGLEPGWLNWLDKPTSAPAWPNAAKQKPGKRDFLIPARSSVKRTAAAAPINNQTRTAIQAACSALISAEPELTSLDRVAGDADLGVSMERAAQAVLSGLDSFPLDDLAATLKALARTLRQELGGSSGPLYGVFFLRCGSVLERAGGISLASLAKALREGCKAISQLGGAKPGDRTMLDAIYPFVNVINTQFATDEPLRKILDSAIEAADAGVASTAQMSPRVGRSTYLGDRVIGHADPGARAVAIWLRAICETI